MKIMRDPKSGDVHTHCPDCRGSGCEQIPDRRKGWEWRTGKDGTFGYIAESGDNLWHAERRSIPTPAPPVHDKDVEKRARQLAVHLDDREYDVDMVTQWLISYRAEELKLLPAALAGETRTEAKREIEQSGSTHAEASGTLRKASESAWEFLNSTERLKLDPNPHQKMFYITAPQLEAYASERAAAAAASRIAQLRLTNLREAEYINVLLKRAQAAEAALTQARAERDEAIEARREMGQDYALDVEKMSEKIDRFQERNNELADRVIRAEFNESTARAEVTKLMEAIEPFAARYKEYIANGADDSKIPEHLKTAARVYEQVKRDIGSPSQPTAPQP